MNIDPKSVALGYMLRESLADPQPERLASPEEVAAIFGAAITGSIKVAIALALAAIALILPFAILLAILGALFGGSP